MVSQGESDCGRMLDDVVLKASQLLLLLSEFFFSCFDVWDYVDGIIPQAPG